MPITQTVACEVDEKLAHLVETSTSYLMESDPRVSAIKRELDKLSKVDAAMSSAIRIKFSTLLGDKGMGEYWAANAGRLHVNQDDIQLGLLVLYSNLGYYSNCIAPIAHLSDPEKSGAVGHIIQHPIANGSFHLLAQNHAKAVKMGIANLPELQSNITDIVQVMDAWSDTDADYIALLDIAGEIMRKKRLFVTHSGFQKIVIYPSDGGLPYCKITIKVAVDLKTSIDMTCDYVETLAQSKVRIPQSLSFEFLSEDDQ